MLGAVVYILRAKNNACIPLHHGRLAHAAFLSALKQLDAKLSTYIHDQTNPNPFAVSPLVFPAQSDADRHKMIRVKENEVATWRIAGLNDFFLPCLSVLRPGCVICIGDLRLAVEKCCLSPDEHADSGVLGKTDLWDACRHIPSIREIKFSFLTPTTFRFFDKDYPLPLPEYVFGSLAEKWTQNDTRGLLPLDKNTVRAVAADVFPGIWRGQSQAVAIKRERYVYAFTGEFTYNTGRLSAAWQQCFLLLAQFAVFAGVGRLTGQGLGWTKITYK